MRAFAHILALFALLTTQFAQAQTVQRTQDGFTVPADVPLYVESFNGYEDGATANQVGDGSNDWGGTMPVIASQPDDIPTTATGWKLTTTSSSYIETIPPATQMKWRGAANHSHVNYDDPIRNYARPGTSHCHQFFGSTSTNAFSTYASLRTQANLAAAEGRAASTIAGGPYNATGYWFPCPIKTNPFADGKNYVIKANRITVYYVQNPTTTLNRLPRGLRYVFGTNMDDPDGVGRAAEIAAANAQPGTSATRYNAGGADGPKNDGFLGWTCRSSTDTLIAPTAGGSYAPYLKSTGGVDPWGGNCLSGYKVSAVLSAPRCYDGVNLWSPGGYDHFRYPLNDTVAGGTACPDNWYQVPSLVLAIDFYHNGFADYGEWRLSSDDMAGTVAGRAYANGESFHTDWMNGWDDQTMYGSEDGTVLGWQKVCLGVEGNTPHECDNAQSGTNYHLAGGGTGENAPDGSRIPQVVRVENQFDTDNPDDMFLLPASVHGPHTIHAAE